MHRVYTPVASIILSMDIWILGTKTLIQAELGCNPMQCQIVNRNLKEEIFGCNLLKNFPDSLVRFFCLFVLFWLGNQIQKYCTFFRMKPVRQRWLKLISILSEAKWENGNISLMLLIFFLYLPSGQRILQIFLYKHLFR